MQTIEDKLRTLQRVGFFATTPQSALPPIAAALDVVAVEPNETVFTKGELGDCMYIIVDGCVRVHDGDLVFNDLGVGTVFGEMAVLDAEVRSATVTALTPTTLFRLKQQPLYALLSTHPEVARGVIHILCGHLRNRTRDLAQDYEYMRQFARVTAAAQAVEAGTYKPELLDEVIIRTDALGQLARIFQHMAHEVQARERWLQQQVLELRIEIDRARQHEQVAEIIETEYFQRLQQTAALLRVEVDSDEQ